MRNTSVTSAATVKISALKHFFRFKYKSPATSVVYWNAAMQKGKKIAPKHVKTYIFYAMMLDE